MQGPLVPGTPLEVQVAPGGGEPHSPPDTAPCHPAGQHECAAIVVAASEKPTRVHVPAQLVSRFRKGQTGGVCAPPQGWHVLSILASGVNGDGYRVGRAGCGLSRRPPAGHGPRSLVQRSSPTPPTCDERGQGDDGGNSTWVKRGLKPENVPSPRFRPAAAPSTLMWEREDP